MTTIEKDSYIISIEESASIISSQVGSLWSTLFFKDTALTASKT